MLQRFGGASVRRIVDRSHSRIPEHSHDWPLLSIFVIGAYANETELGTEFIDGPSAIFYSAGAAHRNTIGSEGFEQIEIEFDPAWLGRPLPSHAPVRRWIGGSAGARARHLAQACNAITNEVQLSSLLRAFLECASNDVARGQTGWVADATRRLRKNPALGVRRLAHEFDRHPSWLGSAYKAATGEGLPQAAARFRVERAVKLLRETEAPLADVAAAAGFCDQSHMNRTVRTVLGRPPLAVRDDRRAFRVM